jgi:hypothetical protein
MTAKRSLVFVDALEDTSARLLLGERAFSLPRDLLPADVREGQWLLLQVDHTPAPPNQTHALREVLGRDDPGGDIKL